MTERTASVSVPAESLRRDVSVWGSFMWGFADVGADIYAALGIVIAATMGAAPLAFAAAGLVYVMIGLAYTELASAYPMAGGGQYFVSRGLGDIAGFIAGSALLLDYTIDIALFAVFSAGYLNFFFPAVRDYKVSLGPFPIIGTLSNITPLWAAETVVFIVFLTWLNVRGVRESSLLNEFIGAFGLIVEAGLIIIGLVFAWKPELLVSQWVHQFPTLNQFMYGSSLAIISYVGLESISQAAQETRRPATVIPRTSIGLIGSVFLFAVFFSITGLGLLPWQAYAKDVDHSVALFADRLPFVGPIAGPLAAILGAVILLISSNTGVMGASRLVYSMSQLKLMTPWFREVHPRYRTPARAILIFSGIGLLEAMLAFLTPSAVDALANMYAFGATLGYTLVFIALISLRINDPYSPRPYRVPWNVRWTRRDGQVIAIPLIGVLGLVGVLITLTEVVLTHAIGRVAGPVWVIACLTYYVLYRRKQGLPVWHSANHHWEEQQRAILKDAEEYDLLETYEFALAQRDRQFARGQGHA
ncbi:MAG TPA: APC family permease [bacterium]|nr:APC family permease [bacterium]